MAEKPFPEIVTPRLRLRQFAARDADGLYAFLGDSEAMRYWNYPALVSASEGERWIRILAKTSSPYDSFAWAVAESAGDRCIGLVNYHHRESRNARLEIGYILARAHHGNRLMSEAVRAVIGYCFSALNVHRVEAMIHPENVRSIRLAERLGFRREGGPLRDYWRISGRFADAHVYGLLEGELT